MPTMIYTDYIMHEISQMKTVNIYMVPIYMYAKLGLGVYGPYIYIYIYNDLEACV